MGGADHLPCMLGGDSHDRGGRLTCEHGSAQLVRGAQPLLRPPPRGDVTEGDAVPGATCPVNEDRRRQVGHKLCAVAAPQRKLRSRLAVLVARGHGGLPSGIGRICDTTPPTAPDLVPCHPHQVARGRVGSKDVAARRGEYHAVEGLREHGLARGRIYPADLVTGRIHPQPPRYARTTSAPNPTIGTQYPPGAACDASAPCGSGAAPRGSGAAIPSAGRRRVPGSTGQAAQARHPTPAAHAGRPVPSGPNALTARRYRGDAGDCHSVTEQVRYR
jgi:hypothetical protein